MKELTAEELKQWKQENRQFQLIDIREDAELQEDGVIEGHEHIRMHEVMANLDKLRADVPVIMQCRTGNRSHMMCLQIEASSSNKYDLYNLVDGIKGWNDLHGKETPSLSPTKNQGFIQIK